MPTGDQGVVCMQESGQLSSSKSVFGRTKPLVRNTIHTCSQTFRGMTSSLRVLPDFLIIGGQRCGTTSLYYYLTEQTCVCPAAMKEVHFFDDHFERGINWYRAQFPIEAYKYYVERMHNQHFLTGEASPYYLFHPHAPKRIVTALPNVKLIALLRNPIDRAYSHYRLEIKGRYETLPFEEAIRCEQERIDGERERMINDENYHSFKYRRFSYLTRGIYIDQIEYWLKFFPPDQFLFLKAEDLYSHPASVIRQTLTFLGVPDHEIDTTDKEFKSYKVPSKTGYRTEDSHSEMDPATRKYLVDYFKPFNARLYEYLGRDLEWG